jgi:hypothetical protein
MISWGLDASRNRSCLWSVDEWYFRVIAKVLVSLRRDEVIDNRFNDFTSWETFDSDVSDITAEEGNEKLDWDSSLNIEVN